MHLDFARYYQIALHVLPSSGFKNSQNSASCQHLALSNLKNSVYEHGTLFLSFSWLLVTEYFSYSLNMHPGFLLYKLLISILCQLFYYCLFLFLMNLKEKICYPISLNFCFSYLGLIHLEFLLHVVWSEDLV